MFVWFLWSTLALALEKIDYSTVFLKYLNNDASMNYDDLSKEPHRKQYIAQLNTIKVPNSKINSNEAKAFWINTYNVCTLDLIADHYPIQSIQQIDDGKVWDKRFFQIGGQRLTLNQIENDLLRTMNDNRIHCALNCASKGCPKLAHLPYQSKTIDQELDSACQEWMRFNAYHFEEGFFSDTLYINNIFDWYLSDFPSDNPPSHSSSKYDGVIQFIQKYSDPEMKSKLQKQNYNIEILPYDWSLNDAK